MHIVHAVCVYFNVTMKLDRTALKMCPRRRTPVDLDPCVNTRGGSRRSIAG